MGLQSLHWAMKTKKEPMLEGPPTAQESGCDEQSMWTTGTPSANLPVPHQMNICF